MLDAVNKAQLDELAKDMQKRDNKLRGGIATVTAMTHIPQVTKPGASMVGAGVGNYRGHSAVAVGYSKMSDNGKVIMKFSGSASNKGEYNVGAGIGYQW